MWILVCVCVCIILFFIYSELAGAETFVVLINFGGIEETINVHDIATDFNEYSQIVVAGAETLDYSKKYILTNK